MDPARLMDAIHGNHPEAFRELYRCYLPNLRFGVRSFIRKVPRLEPYEEEIISRAWVRLLGNERRLLRSYDPSRSSFATFMSMVGANTAWQVADLRNHPSHRWTNVLDIDAAETMADGVDVEALVADRELLARLDGKLRKELSEREQALLEAIVWKLPAEEVAAALGMTVDAVWAATSRLRKKLTRIAEKFISDGTGTSDLCRRALEVVVPCLLWSNLGLADEVADHEAIQDREEMRR